MGREKAGARVVRKNAKAKSSFTPRRTAARVEVFFQDETFWLSQRRMAELLDVEVHTINYHLKEIYSSGELKETATIRKIRIVQNNESHLKMTYHPLGDESSSDDFHF